MKLGRGQWICFQKTSSICLASLGDTQSELQRAEQRFETLRCDSESESRALQELREQRKVIRAEILRAEAQIEMLKDLFVSVDKN